MTVDLPAPFGPSNPTISPRSTANETSFTATVPSNSLCRPFTSTTCSAMANHNFLPLPLSGGDNRPGNGKVPSIFKLERKERYEGQSSDGSTQSCSHGVGSSAGSC